MSDEHLTLVLQRKALLAAGVPEEAVLGILANVPHAGKAITSTQISALICSRLERYELKSFVKDYLSWVSIFEQREGFCVVLAGATGVGKSAIGFALAERLHNVIHVPLDLIRHILRAYLPKTTHPLLWSSSYNAYETSPTVFPTSGPVVDAYLTQNHLLTPGVNSVLAWNGWLRNIVIIEGVNTDIVTIAKARDATAFPVFPFLVIAGKEQVHWERLEQRDRLHTQPPVPLQRYKKYFSNIRSIQDHLLHQATVAGIPIIDSSESSCGSAAHVIMTTVVRRMSKDNKVQHAKDSKTRSPNE